MTTLHKNAAPASRFGQGSSNTGSRSALGEINSRALLAGLDCIQIRHGDSVYLLRATRQGKLLLTK